MVTKPAAGIMSSVKTRPLFPDGMINLTYSEVCLFLSLKAIITIHKYAVWCSQTQSHWTVKWMSTHRQMQVKWHLKSLSFAQMLKDFCNVSMSFRSQPTLSPLSTLGNASLSVFFSLCLWADYYELARECGLKVNVFWLLVYVQYVSLCLMKQDSSLPRDMSNKDKQTSENRCETNDTGVCFSPRRFRN